MDGPALVKFTLEVVPPLIDQLLAKSQLGREAVDLYLIHQATSFMMEHLRARLHFTADETPEALETYGNTVSSTIPILIRDLRASGRIRPGTQSIQIGFGVGFSWGGCLWTETYQGG
jgi:3-oxoacyl-[acyl-carrier-protein] synthase-3